MLRAIARFLGHQTIAMLALVIAVSGGTAYAASAMFTGQNIRDESLTGSDVQNGSLSGSDIQDGSISSADIASGGGGGGGSASPVAVIDFAGPGTFDQSTIDQSVIASTTFTTATAGFIDFRLVGELSESSDFCLGGDFSQSASLYVDDMDTFVQFNRRRAETTDTHEVKSLWLPVGTHVMDIRFTSSFCDGGARIGTMTASNFHAIASNP